MDRSHPYFFAVSSRPSLVIVRIVEVATFRRMLRLSSGEKKFFFCKLTCCKRAFLVLEKVTVLALLAFLPVMSQIRFICGSRAATRRTAELTAGSQPAERSPTEGWTCTGGGASALAAEGRVQCAVGAD